jgi:hypothetical protein
VAKLSAKEAELLKKLQAKAEAPEAPASNRTLNIDIDLGDDKQVARAIKLGLLDAGDDDDGDGDDDDDGDEPPKRRSFFAEEKS